MAEFEQPQIKQNQKKISFHLSKKKKFVPSPMMNEYLIEKPNPISAVIHELNNSQILRPSNVNSLPDKLQQAKIGYCRSKIKQIASYNLTN